MPLGSSPDERDERSSPERIPRAAVTPADADYDDVRAVYNGMIDKRPRVIGRCVDVADAIAAVNVRKEDLGLALAAAGTNRTYPRATTR
jgi:hypothetical protein